MNEQRKIHFLTQELIPILNEVDGESKKIALEHIQACEECKRIYERAVEFDENMPTLHHSEEVELKPLKRLAQFNTGLKMLLIAIRAVILSYILFVSFKLYQMNTTDLSYIQSAIALFYIPAAIFLLVFTFTFFNRKWFLASLFSDLFIILFLSKILEFIF